MMRATTAPAFAGALVVLARRAGSVCYAKYGTHRANGTNLTSPDGTKRFLGSSGIGASYELRPDQPGR